jgi:hypothetical protein
VTDIYTQEPGRQESERERLPGKLEKIAAGCWQVEYCGQQDPATAKGCRRHRNWARIGA